MNNTEDETKENYVDLEQQQSANQGYVPPLQNPEDYHYPQEEHNIQPAQIVNQNMNMNGNIYEGERLLPQASNNEQVQDLCQNPLKVEYHEMPQPIMNNQNKKRSKKPKYYPPSAPIPAGLDEPLGKHIEEDKFVGNLKDVEECRHSNPKQFLYITTPQIFISIGFYILYIIGVLTVIAFFVALIVLVLFLIAAASGQSNQTGRRGQRNRKKNNNSDNCGGKYLETCLENACKCCGICCIVMASDNNQNILNYQRVNPLDFNYYRHRSNRKRNYVEYELRKNSMLSSSSSPSCCSKLCECICCESLEVLSLGEPQQGCMINKVEVYCTECNSKLKEETKVDKKIEPFVYIGLFGVIVGTCVLISLLGQI